MADPDPPTVPLVTLQSKDHEQLLNIIDNLRAQGISRFIDLPQLVVCGDQSSGKSSVLEAVSGLRFPTKDNLCTRFALELSLRRSIAEGIKISICPSGEHTDEEADLVRQAFKVPATGVDDFAALVDAAEKAMGLDKNAKAFSKYVLRVELSGPKQPHLTLVDLPGVFHAGNKAQSERDAASVKKLVLSYMKKPRTIILAVVSAKNDYANQVITKYAQDVDPQGVRTLGIITKPDTLHVGSDSEQSFFELARNRDVIFRLGWHVVKNRDYESRNCTAEERDQAEEQFLTQGIWSSLPVKNKGIATLKTRLSEMLRNQILKELPNLIEDVENGVKECRGRLEKLGRPRGTLGEQRLHLLRVSQDFTQLIKAAVDGVYDDDFFGDPSTGIGYSKRLRAVVQNALLQFAKHIHLRGHSQSIIEDNAKSAPTSTPSGLPLNSNSDTGSTSERENGAITRAAFIQKVDDLIKRTRGRELPGTFNPAIVGELFYEQSKPWQYIVEACSKRLLESVRQTVYLVLAHTADEETGNNLLREIIKPAMEPLQKNLKRKAEELLEHHGRGHPITYNHYFTDNIQKTRQEHRKKVLCTKLQTYFNIDPMSPSPHTAQTVNVKALWEVLSDETVADMDKFACSEALDCMLAYYKVALKFFVDDFGIHAIEECLLKKLPGLFCPEVMLQLDSPMIENIAGETEDSMMERSSSDKKLEVLEAALDELQRLDQYHTEDTIALLETSDVENADVQERESGIAKKKKRKRDKDRREENSIRPRLQHGDDAGINAPRSARAQLRRDV